MRLRLRQLAPLALALLACAKQGSPPLASAQPVRAAIATGQTVILDATSSTDPRGEGLTYEWSLKTIPSGSKAQIEAPKNQITRFTPDVPSGTGEYTVQLVVRNKFYVSEPAFLHIVVDDCGSSAPTLGQLVASPADVNVDQAVSLSAPALNDLDNSAHCQGDLKVALQTFRYQWKLIDLPAGSAARLNDAAAVKPNFVPDVPGTYTARLAVTDSTGRVSLPGEVLVHVSTCGFANPVVSSITSAPASPNLGQVTQLTPVVTDANADAPCKLEERFTYQWKIVGLPTASTVSLNSDTALNPSFSPDVPGDYTFRLTATDQTGRSSTPKDFVVSAKACGAAAPFPIVSFSPGSVGIGTPVQLHVSPQDEDQICGISETFTYSWSLRTVPFGSQAQLNNPAGSDSSFTPDVGGDYAIEVTVVDSNNTRASSTTHVTVRGCGGNTPTIDQLQAFPLAPLVGQPVHLVQTVSDVDSACPFYNPAQVYTWALITRPAGSASTLLDPTAASSDFTPDAPGTYQVQLVVTDATGLSSAPAVVTIATSACGLSRPTISSAGASSSTPDPGRPVTLFAQPDDVDNGGSCLLGQALSVRWTVASRPTGSGAALSDPLSTHPVFTPDKVGSYQFRVVAFDSTGRSSDPTWVTVTTTRCGTAAPSVTASPSSLSVLPLQSVQLVATPLDPDTSCGLAETFHYAWQLVSAPRGSNGLLTNAISPTATFRPDLAGDYLLQVTATDSEGHVSAPSFSKLTVSSCATLAPLVASISGSAATLGTPVSLAAAGAVSRNCVAAGPLTYSWQLAGKPLASRALLDNPMASSPKFTPDVAGAYQVQLVVKDSAGLASLPAWTTVVVAPCGSSTITWNAVPVSKSFQEPDGSAGTQANAGTRVTLAAQFTDVPSACSLAVTPYQVRWAIVSRPPGSAAQLSSSTGATPAFVADVPGSYQLAVQVTDALGTVSSTRFDTVTTSACGTSLPVVAIAAASTTLNTFASQALSVAGGTATDPDDLPANCPARFSSGGFTYQWSLTRTAGGALGSTAGASTSFTASAAGVSTVQLVATAANGRRSLPVTVDLTAAACGSHAPQVLAVQTLVAGKTDSRPGVGDAVRLTANVVDADNVAGCTDSVAQYQWRVVSIPAGSTITAPAPGSSPSLDFTPDVAGTYSFLVIATDSRGLTSAPWPVSVSTSNCAPTLGALTASSLAPNTGVVVTLTAPAPQDACVKLPSFSTTWTRVATPAGSSALLSSLTGSAVSFTPDLPGAYEFSAVATDNAGFTSAPAYVTVRAGTCGSNAPTLGAVSANPAVPNAFDRVALAVPVVDHNQACVAGKTQPYSYRWSLVSRPRGSAAAFSGATDPLPTLVPDLPGAYQLSVEVVDALGNASQPAFFTLTTSNCGANLPVAALAPQPVLPATQLQTAALSPLALTGSATNADDACPSRFQTGVAALAWTVVAAPIGAHPALSASSGAATSFQADLQGSYLVQLVATASTGLQSAPATVSINVSSCGATAPAILAVAPRVGGVRVSRPPVGATVTLTATGFDGDNQTGGVCGANPLAQALSYTWAAVSMPAGSTVSVPAGANASPALTFVPNVAGSYVFSVFATDSTGLSSAPFLVTIPTGACGPGLTGIAAAPAFTSVGQVVALSHLPAVIDDACVPGSPLTYAWSVNSRPAGSGAGIVQPSVESPVFTPDVGGAYELQLLVTDSGGFATSATTIVRAGGCTTGPSVAAAAISSGAREPDGVPNASLFRDGTATLSLVNGSITPGGCGSPLASQYSYAWSIVSRPSGSQSQLDAPASASPAFLADVAGGSWQVSVIVRDGLGNASAPVFANISSSTCGSLRSQPVVTASNAAPNTFATVALSASVVDSNATCPARLQSAPFNFAWTLAGQPPAGGANFTSSAATASLRPLAPGAYDVQVVATGRDGLASAPVLTRITAQQCGANAPTLAGFAAQQAGSGLDAPAALDARLDVALSAVATDLDSSCGAPQPTLAWSWQVLARPAGSLAGLTAATSPIAHLTPDLGGAWTVQAKVTDETGLSATSAFAFNVSLTCGASAPLVLAGANAVAQPAFSAVQTLPSAPPLVSTSTVATGLDLGFPVSLSARVVDADAQAGCGLTQAVSYAWSMTGKPAGSRAVLAGATSATPGLVPDLAGTYAFLLVVTDDTGLSSSASFSFNATCGAAGPQIADDAANHLPALRASQVVPSVVTAASSPAAVSGFSIVHSTLGAALPDVNAAVSFYAGVPVSLAAHVTDGDGSCGFPETLAYAWSFARQPAGSIARFTDATVASPSFVPDLAGEYDVQLVVTDSTGRSATAVFAQLAGRAVIGVSSCGAQLPTAQIGLTAPIQVAAPATPQVLFTSTATTLDAAQSSSPDTTPLDAATGLGCGLSPRLSYRWSLSAKPSASTDDVVNAARVSALLTTSVDGVYTVQLVVSDGTHESFPASVAIRASSPDRVQSSFTAAPTDNVVADGVATSALTVSIRDALGNGIAAVPVQVSSPTFGVALTQSAAFTPLGGVVSGTAASVRSGPAKIDVQAGSLSLASQTINFIPGPAAQVVFVVRFPFTVVQNNPLPAKDLQIQDAQGNNISATQNGADDTSLAVTLEESVPAGVRLTQGLAICTVATPCVFTSQAGVAKLTNLKINKQGVFHLSINGAYPTPQPPAAPTGTVNLTPLRSPAITVLAPPKPTAPPANVTAAGGLQQVTVSWSASNDPNLIGYNVYRSQPPSAALTKVGTLVQGTSYTDTGLADGTTWAYQVSLENVTGEGPLSPVTAQATATTAPPPPSITSLTAGNNQVNVTWSVSTAATFYAVKRSTSATGPFVAVTGGANLAPATYCNASSCSFNDTTAANGTSYFYVVSAGNGGGTQDSASAGPATAVQPPDATRSNLGLAPGSRNPSIADGTVANGAALIAFVADSLGAPIANMPVSLSSAPTHAGDTFTASTGLTASDGTFTATLRSSVAETKLVSALVGPPGNQITLTLQVDFLGNAPTKLVFLQQPGSGVRGRPFAVVVAAEDAANNRTASPGNVTLAFSGSTGGTATLGGTLTQALHGGTATFGNLTVDQVGTGYKLAAALDVPVKTATSAAFDIVAPATATAYGALSASLHACSVKSDGTLWCWGPNGSGQLGLGNSSGVTLPTQVGTATDWTAVSTGSNFSCGLRGTALYCWGANGSGQLGQGGAVDGAVHSTPLQVGAAINWASVSAGDLHTCGTDTSGRLWCWGENGNAQVGVPVTASTLVNGDFETGFYTGWFTNGNAFLGPGRTGNAAQLGSGNQGDTFVTSRAFQTFTAPSSGGTLTFWYERRCRFTSSPSASVLLTDITASSTIVIFNDNSCSNDVAFNQSQPAALAAGHSYQLRLQSTSGVAQSFLSTTNLTLFDDVTVTAGAPPANFTSPTQVGASALWTQVSAGSQQTCGRQGGTLYCWGANTHGESGTGLATDPLTSPTAVGANTDWTAIDAGASYSCGVRSNSGAPKAFCWGKNNLGQVGSDTAGVDRTTPLQVGTASNWTAITAGQDQSCGIHAGGTLQCWGGNASGQLGTGNFTSTATPSAVVGGKTWASVSAGTQVTCATDTAGAVSCWGNNQGDILATGVATLKTSPTRVDNRSFTGVVAGDLHSCALRTDGSAWCTGSNGNGQLGDSTFSPRNAWTAVAGGHTFTSLTAGGSGTCGIDSAGALWCWGKNDVGQVGDGTAGTDRAMPTQVGTFSDWSGVSAGGTHACGRRTLGIYCWGSAANGQLGLGAAATDQHSPALVVGGSAVAAGGAHSCSLSASGALFCWGQDSAGQTAQATAVTVSPAQVGAATDWTAVALGDSHSCGLEGSALSCWGSNASGQIGQGSALASYNSPQGVAGSYRALGLGRNHSCAIGTNGALSCFGDNSSSQLGTGDTAAHSAPVLIGSATTWSSVAGGLAHTCATRTDGSLWCWGIGTAGQLGDGPSSSSSPVAVIDPGTIPTPSAVASFASSTITASRGTLPADGSVTDIAVVVRDASNAPVANQPVVLTVDGGASTFVVATTITDGSGVVTATLSTTLPGTRVVTAAVGGFNLNVTVVFTPGAAATSSLALTPSSTITADGRLATITVTARDANGNPLARVPVSIVATGTARRIAAPSGVFDANGVYATTISSTAAEVDTITASFQTVTLNTTITFVGGASALTFVVQPATSTSGRSLGNVQVNVLDSAGTLITDSPVTVTIALGANPSSAVLGGTISGTTAGGIVVFNNLLVDRAGAGYTLVASGPGVTSATSSSFDISDPWQQLTGPYGGTANAVAWKFVSSAPSTVGYAGTNSGFFRLAAGSWSPRRVGMGVRPVFAIAARPQADSDLVFAGTDNGVYRSTDGSATWTLANGAATIPDGTAIRTLAHGKDCPSNGCSAGASTRLYAASSSAIYTSVDDGATWTATKTLTGPGYLAVDPTNHDKAYFVYADGSAAFRTTGSGGTTWSGSNTNIDLPTGGSAPGAVTTLVASVGGGLVYMGTTGRGLYRYTTSGGNSGWTRATNTNLQAGLAIRSLARDVANHLFAGLDSGAVYTSTNGGDTWTGVSSGLPGVQAVLALSLDQSGTSRLLAGIANAGVYLTGDTAASWTFTSTGLAAARVTAVAVQPNGSGNVFAGLLGAGVQRSTDGGATWSSYGTLNAQTVHAFAFDTTSDLVFAATDAGLFVSTAGADWASANLAGDVLSIALDPANHLKVYAGEATGVFLSTDSGATGFTLQSTTGMSNTRVSALAFGPANRLYAGTLTALYSSVNTAGPWASAGAANDVRGIAVDPVTPANVYAATAAGVLKSIDTGATFGATGVLASADVRAVLIDPVTPTRIYAATAGGVFASATSAISWTPAVGGLLDQNILSLALDPTAPLTLYAGTTSSSVAKSTSGGL